MTPAPRGGRHRVHGTGSVAPLQRQDEKWQIPAQGTSRRRARQARADPTGPGGSGPRAASSSGAGRSSRRTAARVEARSRGASGRGRPDVRGAGRGGPRQRGSRRVADRPRSFEPRSDGGGAAPRSARHPLRRAAVAPAVVRAAGAPAGSPRRSGRTVGAALGPDGRATGAARYEPAATGARSRPSRGRPARRSRSRWPSRRPRDRRSGPSRSTRRPATPRPETLEGAGTRSTGGRGRTDASRRQRSRRPRREREQAHVAQHRRSQPDPQRHPVSEPALPRGATRPSPRRRDRRVRRCARCGAAASARDRRRQGPPGAQGTAAPRRRPLRSTEATEELRQLAGRARAAPCRSSPAPAEAFNAGHERDAARILRPLRDAYPDAAAVRELLGLCHYRLGQYPAAAQELGTFADLTGSVEQHPVLMDCARAPEEVAGSRRCGKSSRRRRRRPRSCPKAASCWRARSPTAAACATRSRCSNAAAATCSGRPSITCGSGTRSPTCASAPATCRARASSSIACARRDAGVRRRRRAPRRARLIAGRAPATDRAALSHLPVRSSPLPPLVSGTATRPPVRTSPRRSQMAKSANPSKADAERPRPSRSRAKRSTSRSCAASCRARPSVRVLPSDTVLVQLQVTTRLATETLSMPVSVLEPAGVGRGARARRRDGRRRAGPAALLPGRRGDGVAGRARGRGRRRATRPPPGAGPRAGERARERSTSLDVARSTRRACAPTPDFARSWRYSGRQPGRLGVRRAGATRRTSRRRVRIGPAMRTARES